MKDVLKKINELVSLLEEKNKVTAVLNTQLTAQKSAMEERERVSVAKQKRLSAMERIYKKYTDFDAEKKKFDAEKVDYNVKISEAQRQEENDAIMLQEIKDEEKKLEAKKIVLNKQAVALKEKEAKFNKDKADLKALMSGETLKGMFK